MRLIPVAIAALLSTSAIADPVEWNYESNLVPTTAIKTDFGAAVHLDGNRALLGYAHLYATPGQPPACGQVRVYGRNGSGLLAETHAIDASVAGSACKTNDGFGTAIAASGERIVVTNAPGQRTDGQALATEGKVYVFKKDAASATGYTFETSFGPADLSDLQLAGLKVAMEGNRVLLQGYVFRDNQNFRYPESNAVYLFERSEAGTWTLVKKFTGTLANYGQDFDISGDRIFISAPQVDGFSNPGHVYVHEKDQGGANTWGQVADLQSGGDFHLGWSLDAQGDILVAGAINIGKKGAAVVYKRGSNGAWTPSQRLVADPSVDADVYGLDIAFDGIDLFVTAQRGRSIARSQGKIYHYQLEETGTFAPSATLIAPDDTRDDFFGQGISVDGDRILVSSQGGQYAAAAEERTAVFEFSRTAAFNIDAGISGLWYDTTRNGEGLLVEILANQQALVYWFTYDNAGNQMWLVGLGEYDGNLIEVEQMLRPVGGRFGPDFDPADVVREPWGSLSIAIEDCSSGSLSYSSPVFGTGTQNLTHLAALGGVDCAAPGTLSQHKAVSVDNSGSWFDPAHSGEGLLVQLLNSATNPTPVVYWFTYDNEGRQTWLIGQGSIDDDRLVLDTVLRPIGARFGAAFDPADVVLEPWGQFDVELPNCATGSLVYASTSEIYGEGSQSLTRLTIPAGLTCPL